MVLDTRIGPRKNTDQLAEHDVASRALYCCSMTWVLGMNRKGILLLGGGGAMGEGGGGGYTWVVYVGLSSIPENPQLIE